MEYGCSSSDEVELCSLHHRIHIVSGAHLASYIMHALQLIMDNSDLQV
jgi:hypothetical protein